MCDPAIVPVPRNRRAPELSESLCVLWEASVRASHDFLTGEQIAMLRPLVKTGLQAVEHLLTVMENGIPAGFMGIENGRIEMLFLAPAAFGRGIGARLMELALREYGVKEVDVNEQNPKALRFYRRFGFEIAGRSPVDGQGNPFPILHLRKK